MEVANSKVDWLSEGGAHAIERQGDTFACDARCLTLLSVAVDRLHTWHCCAALAGPLVDGCGPPRGRKPGTRECARHRSRARLRRRVVRSRAATEHRGVQPAGIARPM